MKPSNARIRADRNLPGFDLLSCVAEHMYHFPQKWTGANPALRGGVWSFQGRVSETCTFFSRNGARQL